MEILSGLAAAFGLMIALAALGVTSLAAFALMGALGLITDWSFRRIFFVAFALGLFAPVILAVNIGNTLSSEDFQRDLQRELLEKVPGTDAVPQEAIDAIPQVLELRDQLQDGTITAQEFEDRLRERAEEVRAAREAQLQAASEAQQIESDAGADADGGPEGRTNTPSDGDQ